MKFINNRNGKRLMVLSVFFIICTLFITIAAAPSATKFLKQTQLVEEDLQEVELKQEHVLLHEQQLYEAKAEGNTLEVLTAETGLKKAEADLMRQKLYLEADKEMLIKLHNIELRETNAEVKKNKRELCAAKRQLRKDLRRDNTAALPTSAQLVVQEQRELEKAQAQLAMQQDAFEEDLAAIEALENENFANNKKSKSDDESLAMK